MRFRTVIVDDEPLAIEVLKHYISHEKDFFITATFTNASEALEFLSENLIDVLFLDINMPVLDGIHLLQQLIKKPLVVFTTAYKEYLQTGFDHGILDYLQKPIKLERLQMTLERIRKHPVINVDDEKFLHIRSAQKQTIVNINQVLFIEAVKDYCLVHLENGTKTMALGSIGQYLTINNLEESFIRVHKSYAVPRRRVKEILTGAIININGYKIPIGRKFKDEVMKFFRSDNSFK